MKDDGVTRTVAWIVLSVLAVAGFVASLAGVWVVVRVARNAWLGT